MTGASYDDQFEIITDWLVKTNPDTVQPPADTVSMIAGLTVHHSIVWVSATRGSAVTEWRGEVVVFTEYAVIRATLDEGDDVTVAAFPRGDLRSLTIVDEHSAAWRPRSGGSWSLRVRVTADYADAVTLTLAAPAGDLPKETRARFESFLPTLLTDLGR